MNLTSLESEGAPTKGGPEGETAEVVAGPRPGPQEPSSTAAAEPLAVDNDEIAADTDSDESGGETESKQSTPSDIRRLQTAKFSSWFENRVETISKDEQRIIRSRLGDIIKNPSNGLSSSDPRVIITDPREYQLELYERAKEQNTIAVLDTGSGKTLIAVLLLRYTIDQELEDRSRGVAPRIAFFVVDSVTLVFQQHSVISCNLDQKIECFCGEMGCDLWTKDIWKKHFDENMVIVCTADVLYQCLMHAFITIDQINLLIFDEAHHAKKNHAYARIMKDFYLADENTGRRPRVFGMTASPVDAKIDVVRAAKELETLLHCRIATTLDLALLRRTVHKPDEQIASYTPLQVAFETVFCKKMKERFGHLEVFSRFFRHALEFTAELGPWCADHIWSYLLLDSEAQKLEHKLERDFTENRNKFESLEMLDASIAQLQQALKMIESHVFQEPRIGLDDLSSKVLLLHSYLKQRFDHPTEDKCIVFVQKRYAARVLGDLFARFNLPHMRIGVLLGARKGEPGDLNLSYRQQVATLTKFRKGTFNCLFSTSIAEEGLDIPDCNLVIRFNLYSTLIQYIQSRGRARRSNAKYVQLVEHDNIAESKTVQDVHQGEGLVRDFCQSLPADRLLQGNNCNMDDLTFKERSYRTYVEPSTGAKLTYASSLVVLGHFVDSLPHEGEVTMRTNYVLTVKDKQFICEVILPENAPLRSAIGRPASRKFDAKRSAAFEACLQLRQRKYLDDHLLPIYHKKLPAMRNAQLALKLKNAKDYKMRIKPKFWADSVGTVPTELFLTIIVLEEPHEEKETSQQRLAVLTRTALPRFPVFPLFLPSGSRAEVRCVKIAGSLKLTPKMLDGINCFTLRLFKDVFNKIYEPDMTQLPYWFAPVTTGQVSSEGRPVEDLVDWALIKFTEEREEQEWDESTPSEYFADKFLVDPYDGARRYFTVAVDPNLKPRDPVPSGAPPRRFMDTILDYSHSLFRKSRLRVSFKADQPVIVAHRVVHRRNWLDEITEQERGTATKCYICPEPLRISTLPTSIAAFSLMFPGIMFRLDSYLIALELFQSLDLEVEPSLALEAVTKDSDNTDDHRGQQMHFQRGMGRNYERLEFLGDCFLKMATSISLFTKDPDDSEYEYHVSRMVMICNQRLLETALKLELYESIRSKSFNRRVWYPEEPKLLQGKGVNKGKEQLKHMLGDKSIADVCEAIIGAALLSHHQTGNFDHAVKAVTALVSDANHTQQAWADYYRFYKPPAFQTAGASRSQIDLAEQLALKHDYRFRYPRLARSAFTHPSFPFSWERIPCYQRLEFLGDSLLDMACVNHLFHRFPDRDPQWLTEHKMAMVSNQFFGALCVKMGFHRHLRHNNVMVEKQIREYVTEMQEAEEEAKGSRDYWVNCKNPPKALPDVIEAYVGAVFVDSEYNYHEVERFFEAHIKWFFEDMTIYDSFANKHPTNSLHNLLTSLQCHNYRLLAKEIPALTPGGSPSVLAAVMVHGEVVAEGHAASSRVAKVRASSSALEVLDRMKRADFRRLYRCACRVVEDGEVGEVGEVVERTEEEKSGGEVDGEAGAEAGSEAGGDDGDGDGDGDDDSVGVDDSAAIGLALSAAVGAAV
ncbi:MAG: Dicer-like protein 1 [Phylliscum demangeonii]|nr:MAG: Dicer-like protein 1 [Phylliscum demangeonii]